MNSSKSSNWITSLILDMPWVEIFANSWKLARKLIHGLAQEGMYEVLDYESTLELGDAKVKIAQNKNASLAKEYVIRQKKQQSMKAKASDAVAASFATASGDGRKPRMQAAREEGGADASEGAEEAQRRDRHPDRMLLEGGVSDRRRSDRW